MKFNTTEISGLYIVEVEPINDIRGSFARAYCKREFEKIGIASEFVQINHSYNVSAGTLRGLHYQVPPHADAKLIQCVQGSIFDVVVDIRTDSPTYLQSYQIELSANNRLSIYVPVGCAHGFQTLENETLIVYHHTEFYSPGFEAGIRFDDPVLSLQWPLKIINMSERDKNFHLIDHKFQSVTI
jgi:dTDP-4-dehydrorhamnose 3,5-epimerase